MTRAVVALLASLVVVLAVPAVAEAKPCWKRVIDDWYTNERIDGSYSVKCLNDAYEHLGEDLKAYSDLPAEIDRARRARIRGQREGDRDDRAFGGPRASGQRLNPVTARRTLAQRKGGPIDEALDKLGPSNADSAPIPLLVLAGLALLLITAGATGMLTRRLRTRRARSAPPPTRPAA